MNGTSVNFAESDWNSSYSSEDSNHFEESDQTDNSSSSEHDFEKPLKDKMINKNEKNQKKIKKIQKKKITQSKNEKYYPKISKIFEEEGT